MKLIGELDQEERNALKEKHRGHHLFGSHIESVLNKAHCFRVDLFAQDYAEILICSGLPTAQSPHPYQPVAQAVEYVKSRPGFLTESAHWNSIKERYSGRLSGVKVREYLTKFNAWHPKLRDGFAAMGDCFLLDKSEVTDGMRNEVMDGMHRLVAYGLATGLKDDHFPVPIYFGTDRTIQPSMMG